MAMRAAPTAGFAAAVRCFRDCEITDGVVDHDGPSAKARGDLAAAFVVGGPNVGGESEGRIVRGADGLLVAPDGLDGEDRAESFFLEEAHGRINIGDDRGLEE